MVTFLRSPARSWVWLLAWASVGAAASTAELSAEERLQAVRQELVQAALQGATQVRSTAWIDSSGALREASSFRHGMQVRGVRVLAYQRDESGQPTAKVQWQSQEDLLKPLPPSQAARGAAKPAPAPAAQAVPPAAPSACEAPSHLRHVIGWSLSRGGRWSNDEQHLLRESAALLGQGWTEAAQLAQRWRVLDLGPAAQTPASDYMRLLTAGSAAARPAWVAQVRLERVLGALPSAVPTAQEFSRLQVVFALMHAPSGELRYQDSQELPLVAGLPAWGPPSLAPATAQTLRLLAARWARHVDDLLACQSVQVQVLQSRADRVQVDQGALAGLRPGEEWLISDRQRVPQHVIEPGAASAMVLARVERVDAQRAELRVLAGPTEQIRPSWQAWPMANP